MGNFPWKAQILIPDTTQPQQIRIDPVTGKIL
jgi:hypothetical protein